MNDNNLPKPTNPQSSADDQPQKADQTVFEGSKDGQSAPPAEKPAPQPASAAQLQDKSQDQQPKQPSQPQSADQQVQLGGKNIPVPKGKTVGNVNTGHHETMGINPDLAPKPLQPSAQAEASNDQKAGSAKEPAKPNLQSPSANTSSSQSNQQPGTDAPDPAMQKAGVKKPFFAQIREAFQKNPRRFALIAVGALVGLILVIWLISRLFGSSSSSDQTSTSAAPTEQTVITYWGLWEPTAVWEEVISEYETQNPGISIDYRVQSHKDYRERLQTAIASGNGPDIFRYHASWVPMLKEDLAALPASVMSANEFQNTFYPVAAQQLQDEGVIVGLPIMYDGLVLYYNTDILQTAGVEPPDTWAELKQLASELTVPADINERRLSGIQRSGLAVGNASNVDHFSDILALLILQNGGDPAEPAFTEVRDALIFYTNFVKEDSVWNSSLPSSTVAFARGDAAMMFAPSWRAHEILALNPNLQFDTAPLPQLSEEVVGWANYWAEGVNELSDNKAAAWNFVKYLTTAEVQQKLYSSQSQVRAFGEPYSRQDLADDLLDQPYVGAVLQDAPVATSWYMNSATHDNGINENIIDYYRTAVNAVLAGDDIDDILLTLESGVKQELRQYGAQ